MLDLGAAPGGWLRAARKIVGKEGFVLGVDLKSIKPLEVTNTQTLIGDVTSAEIQQLIGDILPTKADVIISDMSPNVSGVWEVDHARQIDLATESLNLAVKLLNEDGNFFVKVFQGDMFKDIVERTKEHFARVEIIKPRASRAKSAEVFVLGMGLKGERTRTD